MNNLTQQEDSKSNVVIIDIPNKQLGPKNKRNNKHSSANLSKDNIDNKSTISKTSKTSKTASHLSSTSSTTNLLLLKIPTCCGTLELTPIKTGSLVGTASTIFAFFLLAGIIIATFILQQQNDLKVIVDRGDIKHLRDTLTHTTFLAIYAPDNFTSKHLSKGEQHEKNMLAITLIGLIVIAIALVFLLPIMIGIFESYEVQEKLYGSENDTSSSTNSAETSTANVTNNNSNNSSVTKNNAAIDNSGGGGDNMNRQSTAVTTNNKKQEKLEKELKEIEKKKYEMAFDIYTDFLDLNGGNAVNITKAFIEEVKIQLDYFNTGHNEVLAEALFDRATREISIVMLDTHQRFKSSIAFQKQMKITKLVNNKKKKVNNSH
ncbi:hypothetical protein ABK040_004958 [Willaertia magna]